jgi:hypothetical protein
MNALWRVCGKINGALRIFFWEYVSIMLDITDCVLQKITNTLKN